MIADWESYNIFKGIAHKKSKTYVLFALKQVKKVLQQGHFVKYSTIS